MVSTSLLINDQALSYVTTVDSLAKSPTLDLSRALEFGGGARAYGPERSNVVYVTSSEDATLTEVTIEPAGTPKQGRVVSFFNEGVTGTTGGNLHYFVSPTKAYFISQETQELILWNPRDMSVIGTAPLGIELEPASTFIAFNPQPIVVDDKLLVISNESTDDDVAAPPVVTLIDLETDEVLSSVRESRCHSLSKSALDAEGNRYFAADGYAVSAHFLAPDDAPAPCMLRMRAGETSFDAEWSRDLTDALGTQLWTAVTPGRDGTFYVQAIAEDEPSVVAAEDAYSVSIAQPWTWYAFEDGDAEPRALESDLLTAQPLFPDLSVGVQRYTTAFDDVDTTLIDLSSGAEPRPALQVPGFVFNVLQVR